ncbi:hypothetical protein [Streptomyces sp. NPDC053542]|uniref:hypothetical protein n=1 Tax=Streptomyces sp. NPDC053542 TaxID=3365710 RepID=UPI0037D97588
MLVEQRLQQGEGPQRIVLIEQGLRPAQTPYLRGQFAAAVALGEEVHAAYLAGALIGVIATWITDDTPAPAGDTVLAFWRLFRS